MLNQHTIGGVHFKKGCYPGQEIIARAQYRGQVKRGLAVLSGSSLEAAGIAVLQDGAEAGIIINTACTAEGSLSLAVINTARRPPRLPMPTATRCNNSNSSSIRRKRNKSRRRR